MSAILVILFHNPEDDRSGRLNVELAAREALPDENHQACLASGGVDFDLIACLERGRPADIDVLFQKVKKDGRPIRVYALLHSSAYAGVKSAQQDLIQGEFGDSADSREYSHEPTDPVYAGLIRILGDHRFGGNDPFVDDGGGRYARDIGRVKHRLAALDTDIQGLMSTAKRPKAGAREAGEFDDEYWHEVVEAYRGVDWPARIKEIEGPLIDGLQEEVRKRVRKALNEENLLADVDKFVKLLQSSNAAEAWLKYGQYRANPVHRLLEVIDGALEGRPALPNAP
jgi:hypothetical protein